MQQFAHLDAARIQNEVLTQMSRFTGGAKPRDDMTLIVAKIQAA